MSRDRPTVAPGERQEALRRARDLKMARSLGAYVRGATGRFYAWLAQSPAAAELPVGPPVWICGDCHLGNLGPLAGPDGEVEVRIRDLDQTVIGNPAHDLIRLGLSLAAVARSADMPGVVTARMMEALIDGYVAALRDPEHDDTAPAPASVAVVHRLALGRRWRKLAKERLGSPEPAIPLGKRFWPLAPGEREAIEALAAAPEVRDQVLGHTGAADARVLDAAYWRKGCSSLGKLRFAATVACGTRRDGAPRWALLDIKEAPEPLAPAAHVEEASGDDAQRVVTGARALAPELGGRMAPAHLLGRPVVVRELKPQDLKLEFTQFQRAESAGAARYLAWVVGLAHGAQMDAPTRRRWSAELKRRRLDTLDAPSWLWRAVVDLAARHEAGYLEHCRLYALKEA